MNVLKKVLLGLLIIVVLLVGAAYALLKTGIFTAKVKDYAKSEITKLTGKEIDIEKIEIGLINHVTIKNISIPLKRNMAEGGEFITVDSIIFRFNIIDMFIYKKDIDKTLSHVIVQSPVIYIKKEGGKFNIEEFIKSFSFGPGNAAAAPQETPKIALPVNRVLIENGKVTYEDADKIFKADISDLKGSVTYRQKSNSVRVFLAGKTQKGPIRNLKVDYNHFIDAGNFKADVSFRDAELKTWLPYALPGKNFEVTGGIFSLDLTAYGSEFAPGKFKMRGAFSASKGGVLINGDIPVEGISAAASVENDRIKISQADFIAFGGRMSAKGDLRGIFNGLSYGGTLVLADIDASKINKDFMEGKIRGAVIVKGSGGAPEISGNLVWETGRLAGMSVRNLEALALFDGKKAELKEVKGSLAGGAIAGSGIIPVMEAGKGEKYSGISLLLSGAQMSEIFRNKDVKGKADVTFKLNGSMEAPYGFALVTAERVDFGGTPGGNIRAKLNINKSRVALDAGFDYAAYKGLSLAGTLEFKDGGVIIPAIELKDGKQPLASLKGSVGKDNTVDVLAVLTGVKIAGLGLRALEGKMVEGLINGRMTVKGTTESPQVSALLETEGLRIRGKAHSFRTHASYGNDTVKIDEFVFNENASGGAEFSIKKKIFSLNLALKQLDGDILSEITGLELFSNSVINGTALIKKEKNGYGGSVQVDAKYGRGEYKSVGIDITGGDNAFSINNVEIKQKQGSLKINGTARVENDDTLKSDLNGAFRDFMINSKAKVTADFNHGFSLTLKEPASDMLNKFNMMGIYLNGERQEDLSLILRSSGKSIPEFTLKCGEKYMAAGTLDGTGSPQANLSIELRNADLLPVYALAGLREKGLPKDSLVSGKFSIKGALDGNTVLSGSLSQKEGVASVYGDLAFKKAAVGYSPNRVNLKYNLVNVGINDFMRIFTEDFKETGRANGDGTVKGKLDSLESGGRLMLSGGKVFDMPFDSLDLKYGYKDKVVAIERLVYDWHKTYLTISDSTLVLKDNDSLQATIKTVMKDFTWAGNRFNGPLNFYGSIRNYKKPVIDGSLQSDNFMYKKYLFKPFVLKTYVDGSGMTLKTSVGKSRLNASIGFEPERVTITDTWLENEAGERILTVEGFVMKEAAESNLIFTGVNVPPQMANDMLGWDHRWGGLVTGSCKLSGNMKDFPLLTIMVTITNGMVDDLEFDVATALVQVKKDWVDLSPIDPIVVTKNDKYQIKLTGIIPAPMSAESDAKMKGLPMDLHATVKDGDMSMLKILSWVEDASGPVNADLKITGTKEFPNVSGKFEIADGSMKVKYLFDNLTHIYGSVLIKDNVIDIYTLKADTGDGKKGTIKIENLDEKKGGTMKWIKPYEANWRVTNIGDRIRISDTAYMEFINGDADIDLAVTGPLMAPNIAGTMKIYDMRYRYPIKMKDKSGGPAVIKDNYAKNINWDVKVTTGENNYYYSDYAEPNTGLSATNAQIYFKFGESPVVITGKGDAMMISGNILVTKGILKYMNTEFSINQMKSSRAVFDGDRRPTLDIYGKTTLRKFEINKLPSNVIGSTIMPLSVSGRQDLNIEMHLQGRVGNLKMNFSSEPSLDPNRLIYILTFGTDIDAQKGLSPENMKRWADVVVNSYLSGIMNGWRNYTPFDVLDIKFTNLLKGVGENPASPESVTRSVEIGIGSYINEQLLVLYNLKLSDENITPGLLNLEQRIALEYGITDKVKLVGEGIWRPDNPLDPLNNPLEGKISLMINDTFGSGNEKPTPTPVPTKVK